MEIIYSNNLSVQDYCRLRRTVEFYDIPEEHVKRALDRSDFIVVATVDDITVGMARIIEDGTQVFVMDVVVDPEYQGNDIGRGLMEKIREYIDSTDYDRMIVNLITDDTKVAFYEKVGYQKEVGMRLWLERS
ncbi:MAG: GNAT family N-acetyltransferase [Oscillospiraceae bacterium]|nr:GNAT family N-acetyltransferase [Oscillospiraceae bacterium]